MVIIVKPNNGEPITYTDVVSVKEVIDGNNIYIHICKSGRNGCEDWFPGQFEKMEINP
jgi:hypothetical protein